MNDAITTVLDTAVAKRQAGSAFSALLRRPVLPARATGAAHAIDILSFLFLIVFQFGAVSAIIWYTPQIGEMGLVVFGIIFVWLGATLIIGVCDLWACPTQPTGAYDE